MPVEKTYHVFELNQEIKKVLETSFPQSIWVQGEIADFDRHARQRIIFFQLQEKDEAHNRLLASVDCLLREETKPYLRKRLAEGGVIKEVSHGLDGLEVKLKVRVSVYPPSGKYSLVVEDIDPEFTLGKLEQNRERIIQFLKKHHLLEKNRATSFPIVVEKVGLITKEGSQAYFDFLRKLEESHFHFSVALFQTSLQGRSVEREVLRAIQYFEAHQTMIDVLIIIRGGGSKSNLSWFDNQKIAEAIANFPKPVLTGIGHKTDISIADLVAYQSLPTPNAVANFLVEHNQKYLQELQNLVQEIHLSLKGFLRFHRQEVENLWKEILRSSYQYLQHQKEILQRIQEGIKALDPRNVLKRGFSLTTLNGKIISNLNNLHHGQIIWTHLYQGKIKSTIKNVQKN